MAEWRYRSKQAWDVAKYATGQRSNALLQQIDCSLAKETLRIPTNILEHLRGRPDAIDGSGRLAKQGRSYVEISTLPCLRISWDYFA